MSWSLRLKRAALVFGVAHLERWHVAIAALKL